MRNNIEITIRIYEPQENYFKVLDFLEYIQKHPFPGAIDLSDMRIMKIKTLNKRENP